MDLNNLYKSKPVQGVLDDFRTTKTGRERRLDQLTWASIAKIFREGKGIKRQPTTPAKAPKRKKKENEIEIIAVKKRREGDILRLDGPNPNLPGVGRMRMDRERDLDPIRTQGKMLTGFATTGYLNLLATAYFRQGVRRSRDDFFLSAASFTTRYGREHAWPSYIKLMADYEKTTVETVHWNWEIFTGEVSAGHWSLLIVDRSSCKPGIFVCFDSFGGKHTMQTVKNVITPFPFCQKNQNGSVRVCRTRGAGQMTVVFI